MTKPKRKVIDVALYIIVLQEFGTPPTIENLAKELKFSHRIIYNSIQQLIDLKIFSVGEGVYNYDLGLLREYKERFK